MLYLLQEIQGTGSFYLINDKEYVIGRKNANIEIKNDQSISRKHAVIKIAKNIATIMDCGSKYGTVHNKVKLEPNTTVCLSDKDVIKFGVFQSEYLVKRVTIVTTGSGLSSDQKIDLKAKMDRLGGSLVNQWENNCTHLTAQEIILTIKVLHAIIDDVPIVNLNYWDAYIKNVEAMKPPPDANDFKPPLTETLVNSVDLTLKPERQFLFKGKTFVFPTEKIKRKMASLITKTGGSSLSWEKKQLSLNEVKKSKNKYIFINTENLNDIPDTLINIKNYLTEIGERMIPLQEIAMAIVLCSCEKDCNPKFNRIHKVFNKDNLDSSSQISSTLVQNTMENDWFKSALTKQKIIVPPSLEEFDYLAVPKQNEKVLTNRNESIKRVKDEVDSYPPKRIRLEENVEKRKDMPEASIEKVIDASIVSLPEPCSPKIESNTSHPEPCSSKAESLSVSPEPCTSKIEPFSYNPKPCNSKQLNDIHKNTPLFDISRQEATTKSQKRKAEECANVQLTKKFVVTKTKTISKNEEENLFKSLRVQQDVQDIDEKNTFLDVLNRNKNSKYDSSNKSYKEISPLTLISEHYVPVDTSKIEWISVNDVSTCEQNRRCDEVDKELEEYIEKFRDSVIIEALPESCLRSVIPKCSPSFQSNSGKNNFKKFKKVQPLRPQRTILSTSVYEPSGCISILSDGEEKDDSVEEEEVEEIQDELENREFETKPVVDEDEKFWRTNTVKEPEQENYFNF